MSIRSALAFDYGASSGRAILGAFDGSTLSLQEIHRFSNDPVTVGGTMYWDVLRLFHEMKQGLLKARLAGGFESIGVDTWGVDFGLLDRFGALAGNPVHYRDARTRGLSEQSRTLIGRERLYAVTGNQIMDINTAFQLLALRQQMPEVLEQAETMLLMPDLFNYFLTGMRKAEYSIASTTQLTDAEKRCWSAEVIGAFGLPERIFPELIPSGTVLGPVTAALREELGLGGDIRVTAVCGHDTQSAIVSVPTAEKDFIFISCGTWSLLGTETEAPVISPRSAALNITNEGGYGGRTSFLKNIIGLWLIQESRRQWKREGKEYGFGELETMAAGEQPFGCLIDPDAPEFVPAGNVPERIRQYCARTGQKKPETEGQIVRCIDESLAFKYRESLEEIEACTGKKYHRIHIIGGGAQSRLLCQMTADACGLPVTAGPVEATVYGNLALQLMAGGELADIREVRQLIASSGDIAVYEPQHTAAWEESYQRYRSVIK